MSLFGPFDRIRIVSLPTRTDRRRAVGRELASLGRDRHRDIDFCDGIRPDDREGFPTVGALGCFLSHAEVLRTAAEDGVERLFIFEDDAMRRPDRMPSALPDAWNLVHLGGAPVGTDLDGTSEWWRIPPHVGVIGTHSRGVDRAVMESACGFLQVMRRRPAVRSRRMARSTGCGDRSRRRPGCVRSARSCRGHRVPTLVTSHGSTGRRSFGRS